MRAISSAKVVLVTCVAAGLAGSAIALPNLKLKYVDGATGAEPCVNRTRGVPCVSANVGDVLRFAVVVDPPGSSAYPPGFQPYPGFPNADYVSSYSFDLRWDADLEDELELIDHRENSLVLLTGTFSGGHARRHYYGAPYQVEPILSTAESTADDPGQVLGYNALKEEPPDRPNFNAYLGSFRVGVVSFRVTSNLNTNTGADIEAGFFREVGPDFSIAYSAVVPVLGSFTIDAGPGGGDAPDLDADGVRDFLDADADGDGIPNSLEDELGLDSYDAVDGPQDLDHDDWTNVDEYRLGTALDDDSSTPASQPYPHQKVFASDGAPLLGDGSLNPNDRLGLSVAIADDTALIAARTSAYVFTRSGGLWTEEAKLTTPSEPIDIGALALSGDTAVVAKPGTRSGGRGSVYVFTRSEGVWAEQGKLSHDIRGDAFGTSVAVSGDTILVGAPYANSGTTIDIGVVYVYTRSGGSWTEHTTLKADDGAAYDHLGGAVALEGDTAIVGAAENDKFGIQAGAAYVFTRSDGIWTERARLEASGQKAGDHFGSAVAQSDDTVVIGSFGDDADEAARSTGAAYVFVSSEGGWSEQAKLTASDGSAYYGLGTSVAVSGDTAIVRARANPRSSNGVDAAYVFARRDGTWLERARLFPDDATEEDKFLSSLSASGDSALIGSPGEGDGEVSPGVAYFYTTVPEPDGTTLRLVSLWLLVILARRGKLKPSVLGRRRLVHEAGRARTPSADRRVHTETRRAGSPHGPRDQSAR